MLKIGYLWIVVQVDHMETEPWFRVSCERQEKWEIDLGLVIQMGDNGFAKLTVNHLLQ